VTATAQIIKFNEDRHLTDFNGPAELAMLSEELQELRIAIEQGDEHGTIDALNDLRVLATGALWKKGQQPELSLKQTCKEITSRKGSFDPISGKWLKDLNQNPSTLYTADYALSRR